MWSDPKTKNENMKNEETKHAPAPWAYTEGSSPHYQGQVYREDNGHTVAVTYHDEDGANARLIAAAPDLLAALQYLGAAIENGDPQDIADAWHHAQALIPHPTKP